MKKKLVINLLVSLLMEDIINDDTVVEYYTKSEVKLAHTRVKEVRLNNDFARHEVLAIEFSLSNVIKIKINK